MSNLTKYLVIVGIMIAVGAMLLIYGSQTITGDLVIVEGKVNSLTQLEIKADLDPEINTEGVYAVQTIEGKEYDISAVVIDSSEIKIRDVSINRNSFEDNFEIEQAGTYTLIITTSESEEIPLVGGIGHVPDSTGVTISIVGFFIIISGMIGVAAIGFMIIRQKRTSLVKISIHFCQTCINIFKIVCSFHQFCKFFRIYRIFSLRVRTNLSNKFMLH